jgi:flavin reductase (DIM6/NTAB) family NADH-FMN oxidoreductase RutF
MPNDHNQLRLVMRRWASGVSVVSTRYQGFNHGMTVSSFASVSLDPQLIAVSLMNNSRTHDLVINAGVFGITILSSDQEEISKIFAGQIPESENRYDGLETWTLLTGSPFLKEGLAFLDCKLADVYDYGTNSLLIGKVIATKVRDGGLPLLYFNQHYRVLQE